MKKRMKKVVDYLTEEPRARERFNRYKTIRNLILKEFPSFADIPKDRIEEIAYNAVHFSRTIQRAQQLDKTLRGSDYEEKKVELEQEAEIELGYEPGYRQDIKKLDTLL